MIGQNLGAQASRESWTVIESQPGYSGRIPMDGILGSQLSYPAKQPPNLTTIPVEGPTSVKKKLHLQAMPWATMEGPGSQNPLFRKTLRRSILLIRGLRGYTHRVRSRTPAGKSKIPQAILLESPGGSGATVGD